MKNEFKEMNKSLQNFLRRKLHALRSSLNMTSDDYYAFLSAYGVQTSTDLSDADLRDAVTVLTDRLNRVDTKPSDDLDKWRKRVMGAISGWLTADGREATLIVIKTIAERAARVGIGEFNKIERKKLIKIYNEFRCKAEWARSAKEKQR